MSIEARLKAIENRINEQRGIGQQGDTGMITLTFDYDGDDEALAEFKRERDRLIKQGKYVISIIRGNAPAEPGAIVIKRSYA